MENNITLNNDATVEMIVNAILDKNKRGFRERHRQMAHNQINSIDPIYRNFIYKIITSNFIRIKQKHDGGQISSNDFSKTQELTKRKKNDVEIDIEQDDVLFHELGHACDFWFTKPLTSSVVLSNGKTLREIFDEELNDKHQEIMDMVMNEYRAIINNAVFDNAYQIMMDNIEDYRLLKQETKTSVRRKLQTKLYKSKFMEAYLQIINKRCSQKINKKYSIVLDALSSKHNMEGFNLIHHEYDYYQYAPKAAVEEFFAHSFRLKVTGKLYKNEFMLKLLPESFRYFEELFGIFYDHIVSGKRRLDVTLKGGK